MMKEKSNICFFLSLVVVALTAAFGLCANIFDNLGPGNNLLKHVFHGTYLFFHTITAIFYLVYLVSLTDTFGNIKKKSVLILLLSLPLLVSIGMFISNFYTQYLFYIDVDNNDIYTRGPLFFVNYITGVFYLLLGLLYIINYRKLFNKRWILTLFSPYLFIGIAMIAEFILPNLVIESFANSIALLFVFVNIQKPEEMIELKTGFKNSNYLESKLLRASLTNKRYCFIKINIVNYSAFVEMVGYENSSNFLNKLTDNIKNIITHFEFRPDVIYLNEGQFVILIDEKDFSLIDNFVLKLHESMNETVSVDKMLMDLDTSISVVFVPDDVKDIGAIHAFSSYYSLNLPTNSVIYASELFKTDFYKILLQINTLVDSAIKEERFSVFYQPIYDVRQKKFHSVEALARLYDKDFGYIDPELFIPASERSGAIHKIGDYVLNSVCQFMISQDFKKINIDKIDINLSVAQCISKSEINHIIETIDFYHLDHNKFCFEITETASADPVERNNLLENMNLLTSAGFSITLDDFGSGYSNIKRLTEMPFKTAKIDKSFLVQENLSPNSILINVINMLHGLKLNVVVEGVETKKYATYLSQAGCDFIQGFYYAHPLPVDDLIKFFKQNK